jgi:hypothetical protein
MYCSRKYISRPLAYHCCNSTISCNAKNVGVRFGRGYYEGLEAWRVKIWRQRTKNQKVNWQSVPLNFRNRKQFFCTWGVDEVGDELW